MQSARDRSLISQFAIAAFALSLIGCSTAAAISNTPAPTRAAARNATGTTTTVAASAAATSAATTVDVQSAAPTHDHTAVAPTAAATEAAATTAPTIAPTSTTTPATPVPTLAPTVAPTVAPAPPSGPVVVTLVDTAIRLDRTSASSGTVSFQIRNAGSVAHELIVLKTDIPQNQIPVSTTQAATVTEPGLVAQTQILNPGASTTLTLNLASGKYVLMCNQPAHYLIGMHTGFTIN